VPVIFISIELIHHRRHHGPQHKERRFYMLCMGTINNNTKVRKNSWSHHQIWQDRQCILKCKIVAISNFCIQIFPFHNQLLDTLLSSSPSSSSTKITTMRGRGGCYKSCPGKDTVSFLLYSVTMYVAVSSTQGSKYTCV